MNISIDKWIILSAFFSTLTVVLVKFYIDTKDVWLLAAALASEAGLIYGYVNILENKEILTQFAVVKIIAIILSILPSIVIFGSRLTLKIVLGLIFACVSIYLLH
jgi:hypothetical protein